MKIKCPDCGCEFDNNNIIEKSEVKTVFNAYEKIIFKIHEKIESFPMPTSYDQIQTLKILKSLLDTADLPASANKGMDFKK